MKIKSPVSAYALVAFACLLMYSCKKEIAPIKPALSTTDVLQTDTNFVSLSSASLVAVQASKNLSMGALTRNKINGVKPDLSTGKKIIETISIPDNVNPSYYVMNYEGGGYAIISADKRIDPVLALSDQGFFKKTGSLPGGLLSWLDVTNKNMQLVRKSRSLKAPKPVSNLWKELLTDGGSKSSSQKVDKVAPPTTPPVCQDTWTTTTVGPLLQTQWGQGYPYNLLVPAGNYSGGHVPTGCVATAIAQVMYYWKAPALVYNWNAMPLGYVYTGNTEIARLMHDIGGAVNMDYADGGSNPHTAFLNSGISCSTALKSGYHYSSATEANFDWSKVVANLNVNEPVLLSASIDNHIILFWNYYNEGHEWVCDGYQQIDYAICPQGDTPAMGGSYLFLHMNWGWNEQSNPYYSSGINPNNSNGWYKFDLWTVLNGTVTQAYQYNHAMTYNIHP